MGIYKFIAKKLVPILLVSSMSLCLSVPAMAAGRKKRATLQICMRYLLTIPLNR